MIGCALTPRNPRGGPPCGKPALYVVTVRDPFRADDVTEHRCEDHRRIGRVVKERKL